MRKPLLATKLFIPSPRQELVPRPRLIEQLNRGLDGKLTLISAPAGFGKTTLLSECVRQCEKQVAWLSLDEGDNESNRFLAYFVTALQKIKPGIGEGLLNTLDAVPTPDMESILTTLVNQIAEISQSIVLVLDDYHVIVAPEIQEMLLFVLDHQPAPMHLVIASRSDPPWPLARFRVRGEMTEIRSQEMRFSQGEAAAFLNDMMGLALSATDIAALESRTEGWIAGLQMAALSMREREDVSGFIQSFTGSHRYVIDYLIEEVLEQQTPEIRDFLLKTSILDRFTGPLCDVVVDRKDSQVVLLGLEQNNLFLVPLDDQRRWYRYHHLFSDLLRNHLHQTIPEEVVYLHQRASIWYGMNNLLPDAIKHALAVDDIEQIVYLTEALALDTLDLSETRALMMWLAQLSEPIFQQHPWLLVARAAVNFKAGKYDQMEHDFETVETILVAYPDDDPTSIRIRGHIAAARSYLAELREDIHTTIQQAEAALALLPEKDIKLRSYVSIRWANCLAWLGDYERAIPAYQTAGEASKQVGDGQSAIIALSEMAVVQMFAGNLQQAIISIDTIQQYAEELALRDGRQLPAMGILYRHICTIKRELNELTDASYFANQAIQICQEWGEKEALIFGLLALAKVKFTLKAYDQFEACFQQIFQIAAQISPKAVEQFQLWAIHFQLMQGQTENAKTWAQALGLSPDAEFDRGQRFEYQNLARLLLIQGNYIQAKKVVHHLIQVVSVNGATLYTLQYQVLLAIIHKKLNQPNEAMKALEIALSFARVNGYIRSILDEGDEVVDLLRRAIAQGIEVEYARKLLTVLENDAPSDWNGRQKTNLLDTLSPRELEVLRLLVTTLPTPEIADELVVSVSTVRSHIKSIYSKLDAHSRHEAVTKARELGIL